MKRFKFDLEDVLEIRKFKEEESMLALGRAISVLSKIEDEIKKTAAKKKIALNSRFNNIDEMAAWELYIARLERDAEILLKKAAEAGLVVEEKRAIYLEAEKEVKVMEELKEMQRKEYRKEMQDIEFALNDELVSSRRGGGD